MKKLCIQIHHSTDDAARKQAVAQVLRSLEDSGTRIMHSLDVQKGNDYTNFLLPVESWHTIQSNLKSRTMIMIVTCEGERGWDDYLLLHHFDSRLKLDQLLNTRST